MSLRTGCGRIAIRFQSIAEDQAELDKIYFQEIYIWARGSRSIRVINQPTRKGEGGCFSVPVSNVHVQKVRLFDHSVGAQSTANGSVVWRVTQISNRSA